MIVTSIEMYFYEFFQINVLINFFISSRRAYQKNGNKDPSGTLAGPYQNRKTGNRDPSETLTGPYKHRKTETQDPAEPCFRTVYH